MRWRKKKLAMKPTHRQPREDETLEEFMESEWEPDDIFSDFMDQGEQMVGVVSEGQFACSGAIK